MRRYISGILLILGLAVATAWADDFWVKKPPQDWTKGDCKKMLEDSPWAKHFYVENSQEISNSTSASRDVLLDSGNIGQNIGNGSITYRVQVISADPIRQALARQRDLDKNSAKMGEGEKRAMDALMDKQTGKPRSDVIVFRIFYYSVSDTLQKALIDYWQSWPEESIPSDLYLTSDSGIKTPPRYYYAQKGFGPDLEFELAFPRMVNNQPVVPPGAKSMKLLIKEPQIGVFSTKMLVWEFKLDRMAWNGKTEF